MIKLIFSFGLFVTSGIAFVQECDSTKWAQPGTFDVQIDNTTFEHSESFPGPIMLSENDLCLIEASRKPLEIAYIHIGSYLITIYPKVKTIDNTIEE